MAVPLALAALELAHPTWASGTAYQAVSPVVVWWVLLHVLLIVLFAGLAWGLARLVTSPAAAPEPFARAARLLLGAFAVSSTLYLATEGIGTGLLVVAATDPEPATAALWNSPLTAALANLTGALWTLSLAGLALALYPSARQRVPLVGIALTLAIFLAGALAPILPFPVPSGLSRVAAVLTGAVVVYQAGVLALPFALLVFAAVLPQHVGPEAVFGLVCIALALIGRRRWNPGAGHVRAARPR